MRSWAAIFTLLTVLVSSTFVCAEEPATEQAARPPRLAVVVIGSGTDGTAKILELLQLELGKDSSLEILERTQLNQLLKEQALVAAFGQKSDAQQAFELGKLISAD